MALAEGEERKSLASPKETCTFKEELSRLGHSLGDMLNATCVIFLVVKIVFTILVYHKLSAVDQAHLWLW